MDILHKVLNRYGFKDGDYSVKNFGGGLINATSIVETTSDKYILQRVNDFVFKQPHLIAENIENLQSYLKKNGNGYFFTSPVQTLDGETMVHIEGFYRLFPFVSNSHTIDVVQTPRQAYEAAKQFGNFTKVLSGIDIKTLNITLPHFHDLSLRYEQFVTALKVGNKGRITETSELIDTLKNHVDIVEEYNYIKSNPEFKLRVTHHDTKISNVLFNDHDEGICVIDLDTVMPGYFISDVGDMMRTYLCPVSEEEQNFDKIEIREEFYHAIVSGYNFYMDSELTETEKKYFFYSGKYMIYMQTLRFLTDYLNNDVYYGAKYPAHNYVRAQNQSTLLQRLIEKEDMLNKNIP